MDTAVARAPLVLDLGRKKAKELKKLRKGEGPLMDEVLQLVDQLRADGQLQPGATPVVMIVKQKARNRSMFGLG